MFKFHIDNEKTQFVSEFSTGFNRALDIYVGLARIVLPAAKTAITVSKVFIAVGTDKVVKDQWNESGIKLGSVFFDEIRNISMVMEDRTKRQLTDVNIEELSENHKDFNSALEDFKGLLKP